MIISKNDRDGSFRPGQAYRKERAILEVFPLDSYTESPAMLMRKMDCDKELGIPIWDKYTESVARHDPRGAETVGFHARFRLYDEARTCYCALPSGETSIYANIILLRKV